MTIGTMDVQAELVEACKRVAVDDSIRAELLDVVLTEFMDVAEDADTVSAIEEGLSHPEARDILDNLNIVEYEVSIDEDLSIQFFRRFESSDFHPNIVYNGRMCILGRIASLVAQKALSGKKVALIEAENIMITGGRNQIIDNYTEKYNKKSDTGPYYPRQPDMIVKRSIRGMLPYKKPRGREAFERIRVYIGVPDQFSGDCKYPENKRVAVNPKKKKDYVSIGEISDHLGATVRW